jgi:hypothetical protein
VNNATRIAWILIWYQSGRALHIDAMQLLRGGPAWASQTPKSMREDWDAGRLRRAELCAERSRAAYLRAHAGLMRLRETGPREAILAADILQRWELETMDIHLQVVSGRIPVLVRSKHVDGHRLRDGSGR